VVQFTVSMTQREHQRRRFELPGDSDHDAVGCALSLHLYPVSATRNVTAIGSLCHDSLDRQHGLPFLGEGDFRTLLDELQARMQARHQAV